MISDLDLIENLKNVAKEIKKIPTKNDLNKNVSKFSASTYIRRKSWNKWLYEVFKTVNRNSKIKNKNDNIIIIKKELYEWFKYNNYNSKCLTYSSIQKAKNQNMISYCPETIKSIFKNLKWKEIIEYFEFPYNLKSKKFSKNELILFLKSLNKDNLSQREVDKNKNIPSSSTFKRYFKTWSEALKESGLNSGIITGRPQDEIIVVNNKIMEIITGELLGDGSICGVNSSNCCFSHSTSNIYYGEFLYNSLLKLGVPLLNKEILPSRNNGNPQFRTRTKSNIFWTNIRKKWYPNNIKIVPKDIILSSKTYLHWFLGDGSNNSGIVLYTCNFTKNDVEFLAKKMKKFQAYCKKNKNYYIIYIPKKLKKIFLEHIGICPVKGYEHKWLI